MNQQDNNNQSQDLNKVLLEISSGNQISPSHASLNKDTVNFQESKDQIEILDYNQYIYNDSEQTPAGEKLDKQFQQAIIQRKSQAFRSKSLYQTILCKLQQKLDVNWEEKQQQRQLKILEDNTQYKNNQIKTSRYNIVTFLPLNMFQQFSKISNIYFLLMGMLQLIPQISNTYQVPTVYLPLAFVIIVAALKDICEDLKRHKQDNLENQQKCQKVNYQRMNLEEISSEKLYAGNIVKIKQNQPIPADLVIILTSDQKGGCFVETKNLDGETNLKPKYIQKQIQQKIYQNQEQVFQKKILINYEGPNPLLYKFSGNLELIRDDQKIQQCISLDEKNLLLRGCILRNTKWIYGVVIYTGHETKIMLNSYTPDVKYSRVENQLIHLILIVWFFQIFLCALASLGNFVFYQTSKYQLNYLSISSNSYENNIFLNLTINFGNWMILLLNFVPISLLISLEMVRFFQAMLISGEKLMKSSNGFYPTVQSSNLNEDLGQIQCIFSDKTGTLTCNIMNFKYLYLNGVSYGSSQDSSKNVKNENRIIENVNFEDSCFFDILENPQNEKQKDVFFALKHLSLCHSVICSETQLDESNDPLKKQIEYQASSPDDLALVNFAKFSGFEYTGIDNQDIISIKKHQERYFDLNFDKNNNQKNEQILNYKLLHLFEFTSERKRMSVIIQDLQTNQIILLSKGADSIILKRLNQKIYTQTEKGKTQIEQLENQLQQYAITGLRTLVLASKQLTQSEYEKWDIKYQQASVSLYNREEKLKNLMDKMEQDLELVAATAIEDKLQDQVEDTIYVLKKAGILFWVLTGDKKETAINIGRSTKVIDQSDVILEIDISEEQMLSDKLNEHLQRIETNKNQNNNKNKYQQKQFCLVITGESLSVIICNQKLEDLLISVGSQCRSVIACRVSPKQKKDIVTLYKNSKQGKGKRTLAIGDGANDVNMITEAHVGVGIKGLEGMQAARSSDYAIGEFKLLKRLLLYHGRECYRRNSITILYNFYKNVMSLTPMLFLGFNSGFSASNIYDIYVFQFYNASFTAFPIIFYAASDQNLSSKILVKSPHLYQTGIENIFMNKKEFFIWFFQGFYHSCIIYFVSMYSLDCSFDKNGRKPDIVFIGQTIFLLTIIIANMKVTIHTYTNYVFGYIIQILSFVSYLCFAIFLNFTFESYDLYNIFSRIIVYPYFYFSIIICISATIFFDFSFFTYKDFLYYMKISDSFRERADEIAQEFKNDENSNYSVLFQENPNVYQVRQTLHQEFTENDLKNQK
ncbi:phospholipid-translocating p-type flippase family protein, putative [Ichthyophthirius multifiliis]|uniref:Phospholipid-transporting ATPase n=1 Tax=Ichthyophthirius multifiliis TaxID=5932 RepID=G0QSH6_ICHMU|nr:phospholipid-translocating p-type flippase family protein, putative [Ichthyophthirius multifiliis]EGR31814.1 phospholipid-translocating p-type flippase family protein, putative [Ichthyophthirius multifiliis]|eukprot:XP_004035300.1 phospholipid-translocating p-type flippase family protein, putative [Ichthyophthirius multifiliis]